MQFYLFWGILGLLKWSPNFCSGTQSAIFGHVKMGTIAENAYRYMPKNGSSGAPTKIWRPLSKAQHPQKLMELHLVLSVVHFWMGFQSI